MPAVMGVTESRFFLGAYGTSKKAAVRATLCLVFPSDHGRACPGHHADQEGTAPALSGSPGHAAFRRPGDDSGLTRGSAAGGSLTRLLLIAFVLDVLAGLLVDRLHRQAHFAAFVHP